jgi:hypothetical protein
LGSVVEDGNRNLSRSHVRVKYQHEPQARFLPLATFVLRCQEIIRSGRLLKIEHLLVAPIVKQRYAKFFDRLTDWGPATQRAWNSRPRPQRPVNRPGFPGGRIS